MKYLLSVVFSIVFHQASGQPVDSLKHIIDRSIELMQENSLHRKEINWDQFRQKVYKETKGINNVDSLVQRYPLFFSWINDFHGAISKNGNWIKWREGRPRRPLNKMMDSVVKTGPGFKVERWGDIGYYLVPTVPAMENNLDAWTQRLSDSLCKLQPATIKGWIIDLRLNMGGNIWPMLASLSSLIGDGNIGGVKYIDGKPETISYIKNRKPFGNNQFYKVPNLNCVLPVKQTPVAVITGPLTGSSAEGLLLAFKSRQHVRVFGEPTAGYVTSNSNYTLHPSLILFLATGYMKDGSGNFYTDSIQPDILIKDGDNLHQLQLDKKIIAALDWLHKSEQ